MSVYTRKLSTHNELLKHHQGCFTMNCSCDVCTATPITALAVQCEYKYARTTGFGTTNIGKYSVPPSAALYSPACHLFLFTRLVSGGS